MSLGLQIFLAVLFLVPAIVVLVLFIKAAQKDGEEDRELQRRLGIRRRTRLGK